MRAPRRPRSFRFTRSRWTCAFLRPRRLAPVPRAPDALEERPDRARRADLTDEVHRPDVDPQLERRRRHDRPDLAALEPLLRLESRLPGEAAVVHGDRLLPHARRDLVP